MEAVDGLESLGLTHYEASVYSYLVGRGPLDARTISKGADVPTGRIYDALHALADQEMVEIVPGRPKTFRARSPSVALSELLSKRRMELDDRFDEMARNAAQLESVLAPQASEEPRPRFNVSIGEETGHAFLAAQIARARETLNVSLRFDVRLEQEDVEVFRVLARAVDRGVRVRAMLPQEDLQRAIGSPLSGEVLGLLGPHLGEGLDVRLSSDAHLPFTTVDGDGVALGLKNPLNTDRYFAFLYVHDPPFAQDLERKFEELWNGAETSVAEALEAGELAVDAFQP